MILADVNVLIYAHHAGFPRHGESLAFLHSLINARATFGIPELVLSGFVRVSTQLKVIPPTTLDQALVFCSALRSAPNCLVVQPSERHWTIFESLCRRSAARGKLVADAYLAAFAIDRDDEWVTADTDFAKFPGLRWRHPWESGVRVNPP
jgi:toxin-antitoxin system PIN domain toxin